MNVSLDHLRATWERLQPLPGGKKLFSRLVGLFVPYTATISAQIEEMRPGYSRVHIEDQRGVRNHLRSVHAVALANLAELAANLAIIGSMPKGGRTIITGLSIEYLKKARGRITAEGSCAPLESLERKEYEIPVTLSDRDGNVVARASLKALVGASK